MRSDIIDVYIVRRGPGGVEFLQLLRASDPLKNTWHPIMGHVEAGETAIQTAIRELGEEVGLAPRDPSLLGLWALEQVYPYYVAEIDCIVLSPRFAAEVVPAWEPRLNSEHSAARWVDDASAFMWPGQKRCVSEILAEIVPQHSLSRQSLRIRH
jgi:8-oxo-dGTP pyrophosphatase MutT (NUDIX family)